MGKQSGKSPRNHPGPDRHTAAPMDALERASAGDAAWFSALDDDALERAMTPVSYTHLTLPTKA